VNAPFWQTLQYADSSAERALTNCAYKGAMGEGRFEVGSADPACAPDSGLENPKSEIRNPEFEAGIGIRNADGFNLAGGSHDTM